MVVQLFGIMPGRCWFLVFDRVLRGVAMYVAISLLVDGCECEVSSHHVASGLECWVALVWKGFVLSCRTHKPFLFVWLRLSPFAFASGVSVSVPVLCYILCPLPLLRPPPLRLWLLRFSGFCEVMLWL